MKAIKYFNDSEKLRISLAVKEAELSTSGEVRIYIEDHCKSELMDRAAFVFEEMKIHETTARNGVLIYLAFSDKKFAVLGDVGIHTIVGNDFWLSVKEMMIEQFKKGHYTDGLIAGIKEAGRVLQKHFPFEKGDSNELPDEALIK